jgi:serpin B
MQPQARPARHRHGRSAAALLIVTLLITGCDAGAASSAGTGASPGTTATPAPASTSPTASVATPAAPAVTPGPTATTGPVVSPPPVSVGPLVPGDLAVTVADNLRVRSLPRVASDSAKYGPLLPAGTQLVVIAGPVEASQYSWYKVAPIGVSLDGGIDQGWVAVADHDGTPWVAVAKDPTPGFDLASVQVARPKPVLADAKAAADAQNAFGIALYKRMLQDPTLELGDKGVVLSPTSIATALAMARAGAMGETAADMDAALGIRGWDRLGAGLNALDQRIRSRDATWKLYEEDEQHQLALRMANMAFGQDGFALKQAYLERLGRTFGSPLALVDYKRDAEAARQAINGWVSRQTMGRIPELLGMPDVTPDTRLILVNAIYLKAEWALPFEPELTRDLAFTTLAGKRTKVPTMNQYGDQAIPLATGDGWKATELSYSSPDAAPSLSMTLVLPDDIRAFERTLTPATVAAIGRKLDTERRRIEKVTYSHPEAEMDCGTFPYAVRLYLPRFGIDTRASLVPSLRAIGMRVPFTDAADFSGMTGDAPLHIGSVIHQANIDVDEKGTEAAAATAVGMDTTGGCGGPEPRVVKTLRFDEPFLFLLRDVQTGAILFMGRVVDPTVRS